MAPHRTLRQPLSSLSPQQLRERAAGYRAMAASATTEQSMSALHRLAARYDALVERRGAAGEAAVDGCELPNLREPTLSICSLPVNRRA